MDKILVVDDEQDIRDSLRSILNKEDYCPLSFRWQRGIGYCQNAGTGVNTP